MERKREREREKEREGGKNIYKYSFPRSLMDAPAAIRNPAKTVAALYECGKKSIYF